MSEISLETWLNWANLARIWGLGIAAFAGIVSLIAGMAQHSLQTRVSAKKEEALRLFQSQSSERIAAVQKETATANERAAGLEREAETARLETEKLKAHLAWRSLSRNEITILTSILASHKGAVNIRYMDGDPESLFLASQFSKILQDSGWAVAPGAVKPPNTIVFGLRLPDSGTPDANKLREALTQADIPFSIDGFPIGLAFSISTIPNAPTFMIGSRIPLLP